MIQKITIQQALRALKNSAAYQSANPGTDHVLNDRQTPLETLQTTAEFLWNHTSITDLLSDVKTLSLMLNALPDLRYEEKGGLPLAFHAVDYPVALNHVLMFQIYYYASAIGDHDYKCSPTYDFIKQRREEIFKFVVESGKNLEDEKGLFSVLNKLYALESRDLKSEAHIFDPFEELDTKSFHHTDSFNLEPSSLDDGTTATLAGSLEEETDVPN